MSDDLLDRLKMVDPAPAERVEREVRELGDLPARIAAELVVVPFRHRPNLRRAAIGIAAAIVALALIVPLAVLRPLGDDSRPGGSGPTPTGPVGTTRWITVGPLDALRAAGVTYVADAMTFVVAPEGSDPYALYAVPLEDAREATRERVLLCAGTQRFLGSRGESYTLTGERDEHPGSVERGLSSVGLRVEDGVVEIDPNDLAPGPTDVAQTPTTDPGCQTAVDPSVPPEGEPRGVPFEGEPGFAVPVGASLPPIAVALPQIGMDLFGSAHIVGSADVFEATVSIRIRDAVNNVIAESFTTATCGTGCRGDFTADVDFEVGQEQRGVIEVYEASAKDGEPINVVEIPVTLRPAAGSTTGDELEGAWTGPDGDPAPNGDPGEPLVLSSNEGPDHCGWTSVSFLNVGWPLGSDGDTNAYRQYVRDPQGLLIDRTSGPFQSDARLPNDAVDTGFQHDAWGLWLAPSDQDEAAYLVNAETGAVERWPRAPIPNGCD